MVFFATDYWLIRTGTRYLKTFSFYFTCYGRYFPTLLGRISLCSHQQQVSI